MTTNPDVLRLAREIVAEFYPEVAELYPKVDEFHAMQIAIEAVERTTELAKAANASVILQARLGEIDNDLRSIGHRLESTLERYAHLRQPEKGSTDE